MATQSKRTVERPDEVQLLGEIVRLLVMNLRRQTESQSELVVDMDRVGFGERRIAELIGTTQGTVHVTVQRARKQQASKGTSKQAEARAQDQTTSMAEPRSNSST